MAGKKLTCLDCGQVNRVPDERLSVERLPYPVRGHCRMMAPEFSKAADALRVFARLIKINTEDHPGAGQGYGIRGIPTMIAFQGGRERKRQSGAMPAAQIVSWAKSG